MIHWILTVALIFSLSPNLFAAAAGQVEIHQPELETGEQAAKARAEATKASSSAKKRRVVEKAPAITYKQVLADPDNIQLNYDYAKTQVAKGEMRGAVSTLERILLVDPTLHRVRLFYALVLYRLDNLNEADRELKRLLAIPLPSGLKEEIQEITKKISQRRRRFNISATLGTGFDYDSNRNAAPSTGRRLFANAPIVLDNAGQRQQDTAMTFLANIKMEYDLGDQAGHNLFWDLTHYRAEQTVEDNLDLQVFTVIWGGKFKMKSGDYTLRQKWNHVRLSEETFLRTHGVGLRIDHKYTGRLSGFVTADIEHQEYNNTKDVPVGNERTGDQIIAGLGVNYILRPKHRVGASFTWREKKAKEEYNANRRYTFSFTHSYLIGSGRFILSSIAANIDRYPAPDPAISPKEREDEGIRFRTTFGTPLTFIHKSLKVITFTQSVEYFHGVSNLENYAYDNFKLSSLFTYKWSW